MMPLREYPAILSRLLLVVVLALIGLPQQSHGGDMAEASPFVLADHGQVQGILSSQRHVLRASVPDQPSPEGVLPRNPVATPERPVGDQPTAMAHRAILPVTTRILPPVRAPPAV